MSQRDEERSDRVAPPGEEGHDATGATPTPPTSRWAIAAVICAGLGFSFLPLVGIVLGFVFASHAEKQIQAEPERVSGMDAVLWARRLAWLGVIFVAISAISVGFAWWAMNA